jgi:hypothetical protein
MPAVSLTCRESICASHVPGPGGRSAKKGGLAPGSGRMGSAGSLPERIRMMPQGVPSPRREAERSGYSLFPVCLISDYEPASTFPLWGEAN